MSLQIETEMRGSAVLLKIAGRMDAVTAPEFEAACDREQDAGRTHLVAEMSGLDYISSAGLRSILASAKKLKGSGGDLRFCALSGMVQDVFRISGFQSMFTIVDRFEDLPEG